MAKLPQTINLDDRTYDDENITVSDVDVCLRSLDPSKKELIDFWLEVRFYVSNRERQRLEQHDAFITAAASIPPPVGL